MPGLRLDFLCDISSSIYRREKEVKELKEKMKKTAPNDPNMEGLKKSLADLEVKREDAAAKVRRLVAHTFFVLQGWVKKRSPVP